MTLNDRLDYLGSTINIVARLEGQSSGGDVIISAPVHGDPEVGEWLQQQTDFLSAPVETTLKGFEAQKFALWRVMKLQ